MSRWKRWLLAGLAFLALAGLLVRSILTDPQWRAFNGRVFLQSLVSIDKFWLGWALLAIYSTYLIRALRWRVLMGSLKPHASLWNLFSATVIGFAAIGVFGRAGEMARPYLVARKEGLPVSSQVAVWAIERSFDTLTVLVTAAFALRTFEAAALRSTPALSRALHLAGAVIAFGTLGVLFLLVALWHFTEPLIKWAIERLRFLSPRRFGVAQESLLAFVEGSRGMRSFATLAACSFYSLAEWVLVAFCYAAVFNAFSGGLRLSASQVFIFMGCVMAGSMVQIPGVGGGIQVSSLLVLTEIFAIRPEVATSISLLIWVLTFLVVVPPAIALVLYEGLSWSKLRNLPAEN